MKVNFTKIIAMAAVSVMTVFAADAATFTAIASGSWSSSTTWQDGNVPGNNINSDDVVIGSGITVDLDQDLQISGLLLVSGSIRVDGTLSSSTSGRTLLITGGRLEGNGKIDLSKVRFQLASTLDFTGEIIADEMENTLSLVTASRIMVKSTARLLGGLTISNSGRLEFGADAWIIINGGSLNSTGTGSIVLSTNYSVAYQGSGSSSGSELRGTGLKKVTIDVGAANSVSLGDDVVINDSLIITSGILALNDHMLHLKGAFWANTSAMINSTDKSDIKLEGSASLASDLKFTSTGNNVRNLTLNLGTDHHASLASNLKVHGVIDLVSGRLHTNSNTIEVMSNGSMTGDSQNYVVTNMGGRLGFMLTSGAAFRSYFVGTEERYAPAFIRFPAGNAGMVHVNVTNEVYAQGTTGVDLTTTEKMVKNGWNITSDLTSSFSLNIKFMWHGSSEVNSFDRSNAYISHYTLGQWDVVNSTQATAELNGMYSLTRTDVTSLSPFSVRQGSSTGVADINRLSGAAVYPNPAKDYIVINNVENVNVEVMNEIGQVVLRSELNGSTPLNLSELKQGNYFIKISSNDASTVKKFVKL